MTVNGESSARAAVVAIEPAFLRARDAAEFLALSPRLLDELVREGVIVPVQVPGRRRVVFAVEDLRRVAASWRERVLGRSA